MPLNFHLHIIELYAIKKNYEVIWTRGSARSSVGRSVVCSVPCRARFALHWKYHRPQNDLLTRNAGAKWLRVLRYTESSIVKRRPKICATFIICYRLFMLFHIREIVITITIATLFTCFYKQENSTYCKQFTIFRNLLKSYNQHVERVEQKSLIP